MNWKKIGKALLFPHIAVMLVLLPIAAAWLIYSMLCLETTSIPAIGSYVLAAYTLTVWCLKIPRLIRLFKSVKNENKLVRRWLDDTWLRANVTMFGALLWNAAYALMQLGLGVIHSSFWFYSLAAYYLCLAFMRFWLVRYTVRHKPGEQMQTELKRYRVCGWIFLVLNLALALMIFFMVYWNRTFAHHEITTIALAAYTFTTFTAAIVNLIRYRKYNSPVLSAGKAISLAAACVSILTLESTMLTTFGSDTTTLTARKLLLGCTGSAVSVFIIVMAVYMIAQSGRRLRGWTTDRLEGK